MTRNALASIMAAVNTTVASLPIVTSVVSQAQTAQPFTQGVTPAPAALLSHDQFPEINTCGNRLRITRTVTRKGVRKDETQVYQVVRLSNSSDLSVRFHQVSADGSRLIPGKSFVMMLTDFASEKAAGRITPA